jgi:protein-disulfide isomerase
MEAVLHAGSGRRLGIIAGLALLLVAAAVAVSRAGSESAEQADPRAESGPVAAMFAGIPQDGNSLGDPAAPVVMAEFADPQCPFCAEYADAVLPEVVDRYVRTGQLRLELELLTFLGPDSERAARLALAAGLQGRMWQFAELFYRAQGTENTGYATDSFLRKLAEAIPGLDVERALVARESARVDALLAAARTRAGRLAVESTPSFFVSHANGGTHPLAVSSLEAQSFTDSLDAMLAGR